MNAKSEKAAKPIKPIPSPKGTRDFYPDSMRLQRHILDTWKNTCLSFGYEEYESPTFEHLELYTQKSGDEIVSQLYHFQDKGGRDLALRPEMTPTLARMVNQKGSGLKLPIRWFSMPRLFRYERAQKGRLREFFQLNMDVIGCEELWAELDVITGVIEMFKAFGLNNTESEDVDFVVGISSRKLLAALLESLHIPQDQHGDVYAALDKRAKISPEEFKNTLTEVGVSSEQARELDRFFSCTTLEELKPWGSNSLVAEALNELEQLFASLKILGYEKEVALDLSVVRGLAYYTGIVFEVFDRQKSLRALAGGGRYDNLLAALGGKPISGVGFGIGDVVLAELLKEKELLPTFDQRLDYFIVPFNGLTSELLQLAQQLRAKGRTVSYSLKDAKFKKQLSLAEEQGAEKVLFFGSDKVEAGQYEVKNIQTREQSILTWDEL
jgi:histidyl-tRNA synthetase